MTDETCRRRCQGRVGERVNEQLEAQLAMHHQACWKYNLKRINAQFAGEFIPTPRQRVTNTIHLMRPCMLCCYMCLGSLALCDVLVGRSHFSRYLVANRREFDVVVGHSVWWVCVVCCQLDANPEKL
jgi:hypothetical protein